MSDSNIKSDISRYLTRAISATRQQLLINRLVQFGWLIPVSVALAVYYVGLNNFFTWDDFIWLNRARTFTHDWLQIFRPDVTYFDPIIHLMFLADYLIAGFDHRWYHGIDLAIHCVNSFLVYRFARLLGGDEKAAIYGGVLFASSFAIADAVLWSSSRVDLVSTLFSLGSLTQFLHYLRCEKRQHLSFSFLLFLLALGAKGTPLILPLMLTWLVIQEKKPFRHLLTLTPFGAVVIIYVVLLKLNMHQASLPLDRLHFNIGNVILSFCTIFIPEQAITRLGLFIVAPLLFIVVTALLLSAARIKASVDLCRTGYCILCLAILPVLITSDYKLLTSGSTLADLLASPSHRIYLASVGAALLLGAVLRSAENLLKKSIPKFATLAVSLLLISIVIGNSSLIRERKNLWGSVGEAYKKNFEGLLFYRGQVGEGSQIGTVKFIGSSGFLIPMIKVCLDINDVTLLNPESFVWTLDLEVIGKAEKSFLFVYGRDGHVYNLSQQFRQQLLLNRMVIFNPQHTEYDSEFNAIAAKLRFDVEQLI